MMKVLFRLKGRVEMAINTARIHPDKHVVEECQVRAKAYMNAIDDVQNDEELKALDRLFKEVHNARTRGVLQGPQFEQINAAFDEALKPWLKDAEEMERHMGVRVDPRQDRLRIVAEPGIQRGDIFGISSDGTVLGKVKVSI